MGVLNFIGGLFSSILSGGATGLIGVALQRFFDERNKRLDLELSAQKFEHDIALREVDAKIQAEEWASRTQVAQIEATGKENVADSQAFAGSYNEPQRYATGATTVGQTWALVLLDCARGIVRPALTMYLSLITTLMYLHVSQLAPSITTADAVPLLHMIIETVLYLTTTCVMWWFGTRNKGAPPVGRQ